MALRRFERSGKLSRARLLYHPGVGAVIQQKVFQMFGIPVVRFVFVLVALAILTACQGGASDDSANSSKTTASNAKSAPASGDVLRRSPGKPTAPVSIRYDVVGTAIVGQPVGINLQISSSDPRHAITLHYRTNDSSAMLFPDSQAQRIEVNAAPNDSPRMQQVTVIPQRAGRLFLNVSAEVATENGAMFRSVAIPIQVGATQRTPAVNGEVRETADGETIISMPASESDDS
jgi:hypothetical protein